MGVTPPNCTGRGGEIGRMTGFICCLIKFTSGALFQELQRAVFTLVRELGTSFMHIQLVAAKKAAIGVMFLSEGCYIFEQAWNHSFTRPSRNIDHFLTKTKCNVTPAHLLHTWVWERFMKFNFGPIMSMVEAFMMLGILIMGVQRCRPRFKKLLIVLFSSPI